MKVLILFVYVYLIYLAFKQFGWYLNFSAWL